LEAKNSQRLFEKKPKKAVTSPSEQVEDEQVEDDMEPDPTRGKFEA